MSDLAVIGMFVDEMDRRVRSMKARGIAPCSASADVYTPAAEKAIAYDRELIAEVMRLRARVAELETHIDFFDPVSKCARCGVEERQTSLIPEEGNEWECFACWEWENARERAAAMKGS